MLLLLFALAALTPHPQQRLRARPCAQGSPEPRRSCAGPHCVPTSFHPRVVSAGKCFWFKSCFSGEQTGEKQRFVGLHAAVRRGPGPCPSSGRVTQSSQGAGSRVLMHRAGPGALGEGRICCLSALPSPADSLRAGEPAFRCRKRTVPTRLGTLAAPLMEGAGPTLAPAAGLVRPSPDCAHGVREGD